MDEAVIARVAPTVRRGRLLAVGAFACACALVPARAQVLDDPTRPPAALQALSADTGEAPAPTRPVLQSVLLARGQGGRRVAVIDGQTVRVGEKVHGYVLASVGNAEAVLVRGKEREVLKLYPSSVAPAAAPSPR
jgi:MSHA biogenesis protein MshK